MSEPSAAPAQSSLSLWQIFKESIRLYRRHGWPMTRVLLWPVALITLGAYASILLSVLYLNTFYYTGFAQSNPVLFWLLYVVIGLLAFLVFKKGFFDYVAYFASLNINAREAIEGRPLDFQAAYGHMTRQKFWPYTTLLAAYCLLPLLAGLPFTFGILGTLLVAEPAVHAVLFLLGLALSGVTMGLWLISLVFLSFVFQIAAFEAIPLNPLPVFIDSSRMVWRAPWRTLSLQLILLVLTSYLIPLPLVMLMRPLHILAPLDTFHQWAIALVLQNSATDWNDLSGVDLLGTFIGGSNGVAQMLSDSLVSVTLTSLLLPLGTLAFTVLYLNLRPGRQSS